MQPLGDLCRGHLTRWLCGSSTVTLSYRGGRVYARVDHPMRCCRPGRRASSYHSKRYAKGGRGCNPRGSWWYSSGSERFPAKVVFSTSGQRSWVLHTIATESIGLCFSFASTGVVSCYHCSENSDLGNVFGSDQCD